VNSFQAEPGLISFRPEVIEWKYFTPHPDWNGPRSFAVKQGAQITAHGGVWPVHLKTRNREVNAIHLIDWTASRAAVGAGVFLLKKIAGLADVLLTIGGSTDTRKLLPKLGYRPCGELRQYARVVRPWLHFQTTPQKNWKLPVKFLRNSARRLAGTPQLPKGWQAQKAETFTDVIESRPLEMASDFTSAVRTPAGLNRLLNCPAAKFSGYLVRVEEQVRGFFLLATIGHQVRIVDIRLTSNGRESWQAICNLAARTAAEDPEACEITAASSLPLVQEAWLKAGFVHRQTDPILCYDPRDLVQSGPALDVSLADGDLCFLSDPQFPYLL
jgi:hypothetical protein